MNRTLSTPIEVSVQMGDCSLTQCLTKNDVEQLAKESSDLFSLDYTFFNGNLGSAAGHNALSEKSPSDFLMTINPDTVIAPSCLAEMFPLTSDETTAVVEAIQIPLEHPKTFDLDTGDTSWASTCCALIRRSAFNEVKGFDSQHFFLHCDDVDFSWMIRNAGYRVRVAPRAIIFHHHGFGEDNKYMATSAEIRYSAIGSLMLFAKWGRPDLLDSTLKHFREHNDTYATVLADWNSHVSQGTVPETVDNAASVAEFVDGAYAVHRW